MKKVLIFIIILSLLIIPALMGLEDFSEFSLTDGDLAEKNNENILFQDFLKTIKIKSEYSKEQQKYILSGSASVKSNLIYEIEDPFGNFSGTDSGEGIISAEYDPLTGGFYGTLLYEQKFNGKHSNNGTLICTVSSFQGEFTGIANPGDNIIKLTFQGKNLTKNINNIVLNITFTVEGVLPFLQDTGEIPKLAEEPALEQTSEASIGEDSNLRVQQIMTKSGYLYIKRAGAEKPEIADINTVIFVGDTIIVPKNAAVILKFNSFELSDIYLRGGTEFEVKSKFKVKTTGEILLRIGKDLSKWLSEENTNKKFEIETNRANTSIEGTIVVVKDDGIVSSLKVVEGEAEFKDNSTGQSVSLKAGEMAESSNSGLSDIQNFDVKTESILWEKEFETTSSEDDRLWTIILIILVLIGVAIIAVIAALLFILNKRKNTKNIN